VILTVLDLKIYAFHVISVLSGYIIPEEQKNNLTVNDSRTRLKIRENINVNIVIMIFTGIQA